MQTKRDMKRKSETIEKIPTWALCYIINGDASGLEDEDIEMVDDFCSQFPGAIYCPKTEEGYFTTRPAFGLACDVVDTEIIIFEK